MERRSVPFKKTLFVCGHSRDDGRVSCANPGRDGLELLGALKKEIKARGLKDQVRVARSGCLDLCAQGPNAFLYPDGQWFCGLKAEDAPALLARLTEGL